jgi:hypothetical protein
VLGPFQRLAWVGPFSNPAGISTDGKPGCA